MTAGHFIFIPAVLLVGVVIGWLLGSRAARDAFAVELRRREERAAEVLIISTSSFPGRFAITHLKVRVIVQRKSPGDGSGNHLQHFFCVIRADTPADKSRRHVAV